VYGGSEASVRRVREARRASRGELEGSGKGYIGAGAAGTRYTLL
jgi:hypothetical protein